MIICKENIEDFNKVYLHDCELGSITVDYANHKIKALLYCENKNKITLDFDNVLFFSIHEFEPWGSGIYVSEVSAISNHNTIRAYLKEEYVVDIDAFMTEMLLNSGDRARILAKEVRINEGSP